MDDEPFLYRLYASTRAEEVALWNWPKVQVEFFLRMQFNAQYRSYAAAYPAAEHSLLLQEGKPIGRLIVQRDATAIRLVDVSLLAEHRRQGVGTAVLRELVEECEAKGKKILLQVLSANPVRRLYGRFGFRRFASDGLYDEMERIPEIVEGSCE